MAAAAYFAHSRALGDDCNPTALSPGRRRRAPTMLSRARPIRNACARAKLRQKRNERPKTYDRRVHRNPNTGTTHVKTTTTKKCSASSSPLPPSPSPGSWPSGTTDVRAHGRVGRLHPRGHQGPDPRRGRNSCRRSRRRSSTRAAHRRDGRRGGAAAGGGDEAADEKSEFDVVLTEVPADKKIAVLKIVRTITGLGLKARDRRLFRLRSVSRSPCFLPRRRPRAWSSRRRSRSRRARPRTRPRTSRSRSRRAAPRSSSSRALRFLPVNICPLSNSYDVASMASQERTAITAGPGRAEASRGTPRACGSVRLAGPERRCTPAARGPRGAAGRSWAGPRRDGGYYRSAHFRKASSSSRSPTWLHVVLDAELSSAGVRIIFLSSAASRPSRSAANTLVPYCPRCLTQQWRKPEPPSSAPRPARGASATTGLGAMLSSTL